MLGSATQPDKCDGILLPACRSDQQNLMSRASSCCSRKPFMWWSRVAGSTGAVYAHRSCRVQPVRPWSATSVVHAAIHLSIQATQHQAHSSATQHTRASERILPAAAVTNRNEFGQSHTAHLATKPLDLAHPGRSRQAALSLSKAAMTTTSTSLRVAASIVVVRPGRSSEATRAQDFDVLMMERSNKRGSFRVLTAAALLLGDRSCCCRARWFSPEELQIPPTPTQPGLPS